MSPYMESHELEPTKQAASQGRQPNEAQATFHAYLLTLQDITFKLFSRDALADGPINHFECFFFSD